MSYSLKTLKNVQVFNHHNKYSVYKSFKNSLDHGVILREEVFISPKKAAFELGLEEATYVLEVWEGIQTSSRRKWE